MDRSRFFYSQNSLILFTLVSAAIHIAVFSLVRIDLSPVAEAAAAKYSISLKTFIAAEPVIEQAAVPAVAASAEPQTAAAPVEPVAEFSKAKTEPAEPAAEPEATAAVSEPVPPMTPVILGSIGAVSVAGGETVPEPAGSGQGSGAFVSFDRLTVPGVRVPKPEYPAIARRWGHEGTVVLEIVIAAEGSVSDARVLKSSGYDELDEAAIDIVLKRWRFNKQENEIRTRKEFEFKLRT